MKIWIVAGPRELQIQHRTKSDARTARMAEATINWNADDRSDARTQIADHQQSRLGKSVSLSSIRKPFFFLAIHESVSWRKVSSWLGWFTTVVRCCDWQYQKSQQRSVCHKNFCFSLLNILANRTDLHKRLNTNWDINILILNKLISLSGLCYWALRLTFSFNPFHAFSKGRVNFFFVDIEKNNSDNLFCTLQLLDFFN